ncbi:hypothetical protein AVEN_148172-1 [Araneus ventricosus]|uniref:Uncharacterized protein n=1 Tax=Araneus ventricosus TaxID=182803 RepID=A0A4Y2I054_ARAVE|nr:hypothetical protein AVEN_148172-1 [Araneus ventricosus]
MTIDELAQEVGISHGSIHAILSDDLKMKRFSAKFVPKLLNPDQMETRQLTAAECFEKAQRTRRFLRQSLQVTRPGCTLTTRRQRCGHQNGTQRPLLDQRNHVTSNPKKSYAHCVFRQRRCGSP